MCFVEYVLLECLLLLHCWVCVIIILGIKKEARCIMFSIYKVNLKLRENNKKRFYIDIGLWIFFPDLFSKQLVCKYLLSRSVIYKQM